MNNHLNYTFCFPWETGSFRSKRAFSMNSRFSRRRRKERNDWTRNREKNTIPRKLLFDVLQLLLFKELYERQLLGYCLGECCREQRQEAQGRIVRAFCSNWTWCDLWWVREHQSFGNGQFTSDSCLRYSQRLLCGQEDIDFEVWPFP